MVEVNWNWTWAPSPVDWIVGSAGAWTMVVSGATVRRGLGDGERRQAADDAADEVSLLLEGDVDPRSVEVQDVRADERVVRQAHRDVADEGRRGGDVVVERASRDVAGRQVGRAARGQRRRPT